MAAINKSSLFFLSASLKPIILAYIFEFIGHAPCMLCLYQRVPFFLMTGVSLIGIACSKSMFVVSVVCWTCCFLLFSNAMLAFFHTFIQYGFYSNPFMCSASTSLFESVPSSIEEVSNRIYNSPLVMPSCDDAGFKIFGLSLSLLNALYCVFIISLALYVRKKQKTWL